MRRPLLLPLAPLYWVGLRVKNALYDLGILRAKRLGGPVISVGSLSAGGAGKTPVVLMLAELLGRHRVEVDVLSRGYGRGSGVVEEVYAEGSAVRFGDEPLEMARRGVRVFVGADRVAAGQCAEAGEKQRKALHLMDDGFQHRRLGRDLDVVLLTVEDVRDWLLPAGNLREPMASLRRADVVVVREDEAAELAGVVAGLKADLWVIRRELVLPVDRPQDMMAFCGIARPEGFFQMLPDVVGMKAFPDHHAYSAEDFEMLVDAVTHVGGNGFVTTAKDAVKIPSDAWKKLEVVGPLVVAELRVSLLDEGAAWERLEGIVRR